MTLAAINLDGILPLIVGVVWIISQIAAAQAKKNKTDSSPRPQPRTNDGEREDLPALSGVDGFADLMRQLSGVQEVKIPTPPEPADLPVETSWEPAEIESRPTVQPVRQMAPAPKPESEKVPTVNIRPTMSSFKVAMPAMKLPAMNLSFRTSEKSNSGIPRVGKIIDPADQQTLRRAVLGHIILGKPRAMENWRSGIVD